MTKLDRYLTTHKFIWIASLLALFTLSIPRISLVIATVIITKLLAEAVYKRITRYE